MATRRLDANVLVVGLSLATAVTVAAAAILTLIGAPTFQAVIINVFVFIIALAAFVTDIWRPVLCTIYFVFYRFYLGRSITFLILGALIINQSTYGLFAGVWTWVMAFFFLLLWLLTMCDRNPISKTGQVEALSQQPGGAAPSAFRSGA